MEMKNIKNTGSKKTKRKSKNEKKVLVLFSGGLDSRLVIKILQQQGKDIRAVFFKLPFVVSNQKNIGFLKKHKIRYKIFDITKGKFLKQYLNIIKNPKFFRGKGINPCLDCKIWMFKKAKKYASENKINIIATGEVLGQRPMSQTRQSLEIIDKNLKNINIKRPLIERGFRGRKRKQQIQLARKYKISFPHPAGGCLLCEKNLSKRLSLLINKNLITENTLPLVTIGRHFYIKDKKLDYGWFIVGRNHSENLIIQKTNNHIKQGKAKPSVYFHKNKKKSREKAKKLQKAYSTGNTKQRKKFHKFKL
jgi:PP-loop superfamily ATP-utilizing enzyme